MIGGPGAIVEIDEAKFGKRKYHRGRLIEVPRRDENTLVGVIKSWIKPGSVIISDLWKAYNNLNNHGYTHLTVNHSENFVDPESGAHTQNIERSWRDLRGFVPRFGRDHDSWHFYLAEALMKRKYPSVKESLHRFLKYATFEGDFSLNIDDVVSSPN